MIKLASIISFCTHDIRYLDKCIESLRPFSDQILIPICDHLYNGAPENYLLLQEIYNTYPDITFIEFAYSEDEVYGTPAALVPHSPGWSRHWHNSARLIAYYHLQPEIEKVLFVDVDEIFSEDIQALPIQDYAALRFATYWYFQTAAQAATCYPDGPLLIDRKELTPRRLLNPHERMGLYELTQGNKQNEYLVNEKPIVHHYSWVRREDEMKSKLATWGHNWERDWETLMKESAGKDYIRSYTYQTVEPYWDPMQVMPILPKETISLEEHRTHTFPHVKRVTPKQIARKELFELMQLSRLQQ